MSRLKENLEHEINWRVGEIAVIKKLIKSDRLNQRELVLIKKYSVASLYSIWEGFVGKSFEFYTEEINNLHLKTSEISINILTHTIDSQVQLRSERKEFATKCKLVGKLFECMSNDTIAITRNLPGSSNLNFKVIKNIFECFNFSRRLDSKYESDLNFFVKVRNDIAHGEFSIAVDDKKIYDFCSLVMDLMSEVTLIILNEYQEKSYLKVN